MSQFRTRNLKAMLHTICCATRKISVRNAVLYPAVAVVSRISEILGLSWQDVDFMSKRINFHRQIIYISKRRYFFKTLKIESSNRCVVFGEFFAWWTQTLAETATWKRKVNRRRVCLRLPREWRTYRKTLEKFARARRWKSFISLYSQWRAIDNTQRYRIHIG